MKVLITVMVSILIYQNVFADSAKICIERWDDQIRNYNKVRKMYKNGADMFSKDPKSSFKYLNIAHSSADRYANRFYSIYLDCKDVTDVEKSSAKRLDDILNAIAKKAKCGMKLSTGTHLTHKIFDSIDEYEEDYPEYSERSSGVSSVLLPIVQDIVIASKQALTSFDNALESVSCEGEAQYHKAASAFIQKLKEIKRMYIKKEGLLQELKKVLIEVETEQS